MNAELTFDDVKEVTLDRVLEEMKKVMAADSGSYSVSKIKEDYMAMLAANAGAKKDASGVELTRKTAAEMGGSVKAEQALKAVKEPLGAWNWCVHFSPSLERLTIFTKAAAGAFSRRSSNSRTPDPFLYQRW